MSPAKKPSGTRSSAQKTTRKKTTAKKTAARRTAPKKAAAKGSASSKTTRSGRSPKATKTSARKAPTKTTARSNGRGSGKVPAKSAGARKAAGDKASDRKTTASKRSSGAAAKTAREETPVQAAPPKRRGKRPGLPPITMKKLAPKKASPARAAKFDKGEIDEIRRRLESERAELEERIEEIEANVFEKTQSDLTGEAGFDEDFADAGTATFDRERELSIQNNVRDLIGQIDRAISRIDDGTYGTCERCGRPIDAPRLKALPHALLCMDCKRREERAR
jgi:RNA polymerase-binding protein DksA